MSIKRRDFLKGMLGAIGAGIGVGATKLLPEAQAVESVEVAVESIPLSTMRVLGDKQEYGIYADGTIRPVFRHL